MSDTPRKPLTKREHVDLLLAQGGRCAICKDKFKAGEPRVEEHSPPRALLLANGVPAGEVDAPKYRSIVCKPCADLKTRGCEGESKKHSVAQGDTHRIRKAERIADGGKVVHHPMPKTGRKIQAHSNPWGKR